MFRLVAKVFLVSFFCLFCYVLSVLWRVSLAEEAVFGCSKLIPIGTFQKRLNMPAPLLHPGNKTLENNFEGRVIRAHSQKINSFQHLYGSALVCFECGEEFATLLFAANEFAEYTFDYDGVRAEDLLDRRKDLINNRLGRKLGSRLRGVSCGGEAERELIRLCVNAMETSPEFLPHFVDQRVLQESDEAQLGCPFLPKRNLFNYICKPERFKSISSIFCNH